MNTDAVGVTVARFQVDELHDGHMHLLRYMQARHKDILVILGVARTLTTTKDPLDFETRRAMVLANFPNARVTMLADCRSDTIWSEKLDELIEKECQERNVILYGSRESFLHVYSGKHATYTVSPITCTSGTNVRENLLTNKIRDARDFRAGAIYAALRKPAMSYQAVDTAVLRPETEEVLLAHKKEDGGKLRFIGGFVEVDDASLELAAKREVIEETSFIEVDDFRYIGSRKIDDWRYRDTSDGILSAFFCAQYIFGKPIARDDIDDLVWVKYPDIMNSLVDTHKPIGELLIKHLTTLKERR